LADGGVGAGLPQELALGLASHTVIEAASMATETGKHPVQLKDDFTSPGGTTIAGVYKLENSGYCGILMNLVVAAAKRSRELS
ncbi:pyrroline-5-carboxylate reductase, partial [Tanacetum coccineum]